MAAAEAMASDAAAAARQLVADPAAPQHPPPPPVVVGLRDMVFGANDSNWCYDGQNHSVIWRVPLTSANYLLVRILPLRICGIGLYHAWC